MENVVWDIYRGMGKKRHNLEKSCRGKLLE